MAEYLNTLASASPAPSGGEAEMASACLDNDDILAFVQGLLKDNQLERVHAHVDRCGLCQCLVTEAAHALDADSVSASTRPSWNTVFQHGAIVGRRYRVIRLIARGGMGEVYEAFDTVLQERLALKTVTSTACDSARAVRLLKAEVQLARRISHPNVCRIYDFRTHEMEPSGALVNFLVMEYVEGECLGRKLREFGALPIEQAQSIAGQLLLGLRAAHQAGILHRDLKSDNVMLRTESNGHIVPVILDFGLAKALNDSGNASSTLNQGQGMVGTIGYMSPEQLEGEPQSTASDIYALGVVWFEMLTGHLPFVGESPVAAAMARLRHAPAAPSSINPEVPKWLDDVVLHCLSRTRNARFSSAEQVLEAMARQGPSPRNRRAVRRGWIAAALVALASVPFLGQLPTRAKPAPRIELFPAKPVSPLAMPNTAPLQVILTPPDSALLVPELEPMRSPAGPLRTREHRKHSRTQQDTGIGARSAGKDLGSSTGAPPEEASKATTTPVREPDWLPLESDRPSRMN